MSTRSERLAQAERKREEFRATHEYYDKEGYLVIPAGPMLRSPAPRAVVRPAYVSPFRVESARYDPLNPHPWHPPMRYIEGAGTGPQLPPMALPPTRLERKSDAGREVKINPVYAAPPSVIPPRKSVRFADIARPATYLHTVRRDGLSFGKITYPAFMRTSRKRRYGGAYGYRPRSYGRRRRGLPTRRFRGRGGYWGDIWNRYKSYVIPTIGGLAGVGTGAGWDRGWGLGRQVSRFVGLGAYRKRGPGGKIVIKGRQPEMHGNMENGLRVMHHEVIADVRPQGAPLGRFQVKRISINPGLHEDGWKWLSSIAAVFSQYDVNGMVFTYRPMVSTGSMAANVQTVGQVALATDLNIMRASPGSMVECQQFQFNSYGKTTQELVCGIEEDKKKGGKITNHLLIRYGDEEAEDVGPKQFYDDGVLFICMEGLTQDLVYGQIIVSYDLTFYNPAPNHWMNAPAGVKAVVKNVDTTHPFGAAESDFTMEYNSLGLRWVSPTELAIDGGTDGLYQLQYVAHSEGGQENTVPTLTYGGGAAVNAAQFNEGGDSHVATTNIMSAVHFHISHFDLSGRSALFPAAATITASNAAIVGCDSVDFIITKLHGSMDSA